MAAALRIFLFTNEPIRYGNSDLHITQVRKTGRDKCAVLRWSFVRFNAGLAFEAFFLRPAGRLFVLSQILPHIIYRLIQCDVTQYLCRTRPQQNLSLSRYYLSTWEYIDTKGTKDCLLRLRKFSQCNNHQEFAHTKISV